MKINKPKSLSWKQFWAIKNNGKEKKDNKPQIGFWYKKRALGRKRHCEKCAIQRTMEELENCHCECHKVNTS
ncbi:MAG: hypothetical protein IIA83_04365 [Thaumarchaeota archaeon]|nr:hypothetical protein [Nitrososphaerota archaeon]